MLRIGYTIHMPSLRVFGKNFLHNLNLFEGEFVCVGVHFDGVTFREPASQQFRRERILQTLLNGSLEGPGAEGGGVALKIQTHVCKLVISVIDYILLKPLI